MTVRSLALFALLFPVASLARPPGLERGGEHRGPPPIEQRVAHLTERLGLDEGQAAAVTAVMEQAHAEGKAVREAVHSAMTEVRAAREAGDEKALKSALKTLDAAKEDARAVREDAHEAIRAELTLDQQAVFAEIPMEHGPRGANGPDGRRGERGQGPDGQRGECDGSKDDAL